MSKKVKKILIITYAKVGDSFILVPTLNFLKEYYKNSTIDIFAEKRKYSHYNIKYALHETKLIRNFYLIDIENNIIIKKIKLFFLLQHLKKEKYDIVYILLPPYRPATPKLFLSLYEIIKKINPKYFLIPNFIEWKRSLDNRYLEMIPSIKYIFSFVTNNIQENFNIEEYLFYNKINSITTIDKKEKYIVVTLKTDMEVKNYTIKKMEEILFFLKDKYKCNFAFVGTLKEKDLIESFANKFSNSQILINKDFNYLYQFFIQNSNFYLGLDTGIMHLANLAKLPIFAIFSARDVPGSWYPYGVEFKIIRQQVECEGCLNVNKCPYDMKCMNIEVQEIIYELTSFLKKIKYS